MDDAMHRGAEEMLARLWEKHQGLMQQRMQVLSQAKEDLLAGCLTRELRARAAGEAHKLAGALGTFGMQRGTDAAHEISRLLTESTLSPDEIIQVAGLVDEIGAVLRRGRPAPTTVG